MEPKGVGFFSRAWAADLRLFCFPHAGGSAAIYRDWGRLLPKNVAVCPVELPGRGVRLKEPLMTDVRSLAEKLAAELRPYLDLPFAFFGHSMGALISFELARHLRNRRRSGPAHLFVSGHGGPQLPRRQDPTYDLSEPDFLKRLQTLNGTPKHILENKELMQLVLPVIRADFELVETYIYSAEAPLNCPITAFGGVDDEDAEPSELDEWRVHTTGGFKRHLFPGDHFFIKSSESLLLKTLGRSVSDCVVAPNECAEPLLV